MYVLQVIVRAGAAQVLLTIGERLAALYSRSHPRTKQVAFVDHLSELNQLKPILHSCKSTLVVITVSVLLSEAAADREHFMRISPAFILPITTIP